MKEDNRVYRMKGEGRELSIQDERGRKRTKYTGKKEKEDY